MKAQAISSILVAIDFSPSSRIALREAARLASLYQAQLTAVHVVDPFLVHEMKREMAMTEADVVKQIEARLLSFAESADAGCGALNVDVRSDNPSPGLLAACQAHAADLLVMGAHGSHGERARIGPIAAQCIRRIPAEVLIVHENSPGPFRHIVACTDLSETSARAVSTALRVAKHESASVDCVHIFQSVFAMTMDYGGLGVAIPMPDPEFLGLREKEVAEFLQPLTAATDVPVQSHVIEQANVRQGVIDHVRNSQAGLVVLGTRGKNGLREFFLGTTAEKIIANAPCSILVIKPENFVGEEIS